MKKRVWLLVILAVFLSGCIALAPTETTTTTTVYIPPEEQILTMCDNLLKAEQTGDELLLMSLIPIDSPDYEHVLETSQARKSLDYVINNYGCKLLAIDGDTAKVEVTYDYEINDEPDVKGVVWTVKQRNNQWVYWHGSR